MPKNTVHGGASQYTEAPAVAEPEVIAPVEAEPAPEPDVKPKPKKA
jgi:hypothetical protein